MALISTIFCHKKPTIEHHISIQNSEISKNASGFDHFTIVISQFAPTVCSFIFKFTRRSTVSLCAGQNPLRVIIQNCIKTTFSGPYDYNQFYYYDYEGDQVYCEASTCTASCNQYLNMASGRCIEDVCYCQQPERPERPDAVDPHDDWNYGHQSGNYTIYSSGETPFGNLITHAIVFTEWARKFPTCANPPQSPISMENVLLRNLEKKVALKNYDTPLGLIVEKTGHGGIFNLILHV